MDLSGCDKVTALKHQMMDLNIAECQHILNHLQHNRDDLLVCFTLPYNWFNMDVAHFKVFKEWLVSNKVIDLEEIVKDVFAAAPDTIEMLKTIPIEQVLVKLSPGDEEEESEGASDDSVSAKAESA
jgi:hypothetical protein